MAVVSGLRWAVLALAMLAGACAGVQLVDRYDLAIEEGVNKYHKDATKFLKESAAYDSKVARDFYSTAAADLANSIVRAQVVAVGTTCQAPQIVEQITAKVREGMVMQRLADDVPTPDVSLTDGSCTVVALKALQANHNRLEAMHRRNRVMGPARAALASALIGDTVRIVLVIEAAKKP